MTGFLLLLAAHILADFYLQPTHWVIAKRRDIQYSKYLYYHILVVFVCSYIFLGRWSNPLPAISVAILHGFIDVIKLKYDKKGSTQWFVADQVMHIISIALVSIAMSNNFAIVALTIAEWYHTPKILANVAGLLGSLTPISFLVGMLTKPWRDELERLVPNADDRR